MSSTRYRVIRRRLRRYARAGELELAANNDGVTPHARWGRATYEL